MGEKSVKAFKSEGPLYGESPAPAKAVAKKPVNKQELVSTTLELAGIGSFSAGLWLIAPWCGLIGLGLCLILLGVASGRTWDGKAE